MVVGASPVAVTKTSDFALALSKEFQNIQATIECGFTLKRVRDMTRTCSHDDDNLQIPGDNLYRGDHPLNIKRGGVCIYYKISLPLKIKNIHYLQECINFDIKIKEKLCNFISLYR